MLARIVVVDDEQMVLSATQKILEAIGFDVTAVTCGKEALGILEAGADGFDGVVTDVNMPGINGVELATQVSARWPDLGVLLVSGKESESDVMRGLPEKYQYLRKPYGIDKLRSALEAALTC